MGRVPGVKCMGEDFNNCDMDDDAVLISRLCCFLNHFSSATSTVDVDVEDFDIDWMVLI